MPTPILLTSNLTTGLASVTFVGTLMPIHASALGQAVSLWLSSEGIVTGILPSGLLGTGQGVGTLVLPLPAIEGTILSALVSSGNVGTQIPLLAKGIALGLSITPHQVISPPLPIGSGAFSGIFACGSLHLGLLSQINTAYASRGMILSPTIALGLSLGIYQSYLTSIISGAIIGAPSSGVASAVPFFAKVV